MLGMGDKIADWMDCNGCRGIGNHQCIQRMVLCCR